MKPFLQSALHYGNAYHMQLSIHINANTVKHLRKKEFLFGNNAKKNSIYRGKTKMGEER